LFEVLAYLARGVGIRPGAGFRFLETRDRSRRAGHCQLVSMLSPGPLARSQSA
jgi:hypothetical protein